MEDSTAIIEWLQRCAAARSAGRSIPDAALFRQLLRHSFLAEADAQGAVVVTDGAADVFCCAAEAASAAPNGATSFSGLELAAALPDHTCEMRLHYGSGQPPLVCTADEVLHFRSFLQVSVVESLLERLYAGADLQVDHPFARLRAFGDFFVLCAGGVGTATSRGTEREGRLLMALAPDTEGRKLTAAFTAQDALQLFVVARESDPSREAISVRVSGNELFTNLANSPELDGVVFNPAGPGQPCALSRQLAMAVLEAE